jgi:uncharacterized YigZ family protein
MFLKIEAKQYLCKMQDTYRSITKASPEVLFKEKGSKFFGYAFPVKTEEEVEDALQLLKKKHHKARHFCYAYQLGMQYEKYRVNDDGEPSNSAGMPIYGQLQSFEVTHILVVVVRYFGGTKLGVGGLISAYKTTAQLSLEASKISSFEIQKNLYLQCTYDLMNSVMRLVKEENLAISKQELLEDCTFTIPIRLNDFEAVRQKAETIYGLNVWNEGEEEK